MKLLPEHIKKYEIFHTKELQYTNMSICLHNKKRTATEKIETISLLLFFLSSNATQPETFPLKKVH